MRAGVGLAVDALGGEVPHLVPEQELGVVVEGLFRRRREHALLRELQLEEHVGEPEKAESGPQALGVLGHRNSERLRHDLEADGVAALLPAHVTLRRARVLEPVPLLLRQARDLREALGLPESLGVPDFQLQVRLGRRLRRGDRPPAVEVLLELFLEEENVLPRQLRREVRRQAFRISFVLHLDPLARGLPGLDDVADFEGGLVAAGREVEFQGVLEEEPEVLPVVDEGGQVAHGVDAHFAEASQGLVVALRSREHRVKPGVELGDVFRWRVRGRAASCHGSRR